MSGPAAPAVLSSPDTVAHTVAYTGADPDADSASAPVTVQAGETLLLAGLRAGLPLPYECASGGCGSCKARLVSGELRSLWEEAPGLSERDRRKGDRVLLCQSVPEGDCEVRVSPVSAGLTAPAPTRTAARLLSRREVCAETMVITVGTETGLDWLPGQFVHLEFPDGVRRAYSMTHPADPDGSRALEFLVRAKPDGQASAWLSGRLAEGDPLVVEGPYGKAHAQSALDRPVVCLGGGTGLAPILAIATRLQEQSPGRSLRIYVGARTADDVVLTERLAVLGQRGADVVIAVDGGFGRDHDVLGPMRSGMVLDHLVADVPDLSGHDVYLAGPPAMVEASLRRLVREGTAPADRLFVDKFL